MDRLLEFRDTLNDIDSEIIELLGKRYDVCREIGHFKKEQGIPMMHPDRVEEVKARCAAQAEIRGLNPELARQLFTLIIDEACRMQDGIIDAQQEGTA